MSDFYFALVWHLDFWRERIAKYIYTNKSHNKTNNNQFKLNWIDEHLALRRHCRTIQFVKLKKKYQEKATTRIKQEKKNSLKNYWKEIYLLEIGFKLKAYWNLNREMVMKCAWVYGNRDGNIGCWRFFMRRMHFFLDFFYSYSE